MLVFSTVQIEHSLISFSLYARVLYAGVRVRVCVHGLSCICVQLHLVRNPLVFQHVGGVHMIGAICISMHIVMCACITLNVTWRYACMHQQPLYTTSFHVLYIPMVCDYINVCILNIFITWFTIYNA